MYGPQVRNKGQRLSLLSHCFDYFVPCVLEISFGVAKKETTFQNEKSEQGSFTLHQDSVLRKSQEKTGSAFGFYSNSGDLAVLFNWLVWKKLAQRKLRRKGKGVTAPSDQFPRMEQGRALCKQKFYWVGRIQTSP